MDHSNNQHCAGSRKRARLTNTDYAIACVVPLGVELAPLRAMLDSIHEDLPANRPRNAYILGEIGQHNVVISVLPSTGNNDSGVVANQLMNDFPSVQFGLLVGIAGGIPGTEGKNDIRLGDVVVSEPTGTAGGVIQFDRGKRHGQDNFELTGHLNKPSPTLNATLKKLQAQHIQEGNKTQRFITDMLSRNPEMKEQFTCPGPENDFLFESNYRHNGEDNCRSCDLAKIIKRSIRLSDTNVIHYGTIGSSNAVIKDAVERNRLGRQYGMLAVEMEAAGLMDTLPCLVIRGICDYADSHKNKIWQPYAAAVAAAYAKELIQTINPTKPIVLVPSHDLDVSSDPLFQQLTEALNFDRMDARLRNIDEPLLGTCQWIFRNKEFQHWASRESLENNHGFLWVKGKPGCGKSTLMKSVLHWAKENWSQESIVSFFFNARAFNDLEKSSLGLYRSLLAQILQQRPNLHGTFLNTFKSKVKNGTVEAWTPSELKVYLIQSIYGLHTQPLNVFVDALDEGEEDDVRQMVVFLEDLTSHAHQTNLKLRICLSSRHFPHISIRKGLFVNVENQIGHENDIEQYIAARMSDSTSDELEMLRARIQEKSAGIFLWVVLVVPILNKVYDRYRSASLMSQRLQDLPSELDRLFMNIIGQSDDNIQECLSLLQWVSFANGAMTPSQLYHAIKASTMPLFDPGDTPSDDDCQIYLLTASRGLVELTKSKFPDVQFIHETVRDFLRQKGLAQIDPDLAANVEGMSHEKLKTVCFQFIDLYPLPTLQTEYGRYRYPPGMTYIYPFIEYATPNLFWHAENAALHGISQQGFLRRLRGTSCTFVCDWVCHNSAIHRAGIEYRRRDRGHDAEDHLLCLVIRENLPTLINTLIADGVNPNTSSRHFGTVLQLASIVSDEEVVASLIKAGAYIDAQGGEHGGVLQAACVYDRREIVRVLLEHGAKVNARGGVDGSALYAACNHLYDTTDLVRLLLEYGADPNLESGPNGRALQVAISNYQKKVAHFLLSHGANPNLEGGPFGNALQTAVAKDMKETVRLLLSHGVEVNTRNGEYGNALQAACVKSGVSIVRLLLNHGADINAQGGAYGTALLAAVAVNKIEFVRLLLKKGADVNALWEARVTALMTACATSTVPVLRLLLEHGADPNLRGSSRYSPLTIACERGAKDMMQVLLKCGARANDADALEFARRGRHRGLVKLLVQYGADGNKRPIRVE